MGVSSSRENHDPVVKQLDFSKTEAAGRTPLGALPANARLVPASPARKEKPAVPPTPEVTASARKDESLRKAHIATLRGGAVQTAVACQLAHVAGSEKFNMKQLKSVQAVAQAIASSSTAELQSAAEELNAVHQRQLNRARRARGERQQPIEEEKAERVDACCGQTPRAAHRDEVEEEEVVEEEVMGDAEVPATPIVHEDATCTPATSQPSGGAAAPLCPNTEMNDAARILCGVVVASPLPPSSSSKLVAPANLPPPRSTPSAMNTPKARGVNVKATIKGLDQSGGNFDGPGFVKGYLTMRREQLAEQKAAAAEMHAQLAALEARQIEQSSKAVATWSGGSLPGCSALAMMSGGEQAAMQSVRKVSFEGTKADEEGGAHPIKGLRLPLTPEELTRKEEEEEAKDEEAVQVPAKPCPSSRPSGIPRPKPKHTAAKEAAVSEEEALRSALLSSPTKGGEAEEMALLKKQLAQLQKQLEHEKTHTRRMLHAKVICHNCDSVCDV